MNRLTDLHAARLRRLAWYWFALDLPPAWEVVGYSPNPREGQIDLATRHGHQCRVYWRKTKHRPDEVRILTELHRRAIAEHDPARAEALRPLTTERLEPFVLVYGDVGDPCQAATYLAHDKVMLQFHWPSLDSQALQTSWKAMLRSVSTPSDGVVEWALFGLWLTLPASFELDEVTPNPGAVAFTFVGPKHVEVIHRRWAMPEVCLAGGDLCNFYGRILKQLNCRLLETTQTTLFGCDAAAIKFEKRGRIGLDKLSGRWWPGHGIAWHDREENRLYSFEQAGPARAPQLEIADVVRGY